MPSGFLHLFINLGTMVHTKTSFWLVFSGHMPFTEASHRLLCGESSFGWCLSIIAGYKDCPQTAGVHYAQITVCFPLKASVLYSFKVY